MNEKRVDFWDLLRGIGMITVIFSHAVNYLDGERFANWAVWVMSTYEMVVFFVIAGVVSALGRAKCGFWQRIARKAKVLMFPYLFCAVIAHLIFREWAIWDYICNGGLWFLRVLFFVFLLHELARIIADLVAKKAVYRIGWLIGLLVSLSIGWSAASIPGVTAFRQLGYFFMWFEVGFWASRNWTNCNWLNHRWIRFAYQWAPIGFVALIPALIETIPGIRRLIIPVMALLGTVSCMRLVEWLQARQFVSGWDKIVGWVRFTGRYSLMFYILHVFVGHACCRYLPVTGLRNELLQIVLSVPIFAAWYGIVAVMVQGWQKLRNFCCLRCRV